MNRCSLCQFLKWVWENSEVLSFSILMKQCTIRDLPEKLLLTCSFTLACPSSQVTLTSKGNQTAKKKHECTVGNMGQIYWWSHSCMASLSAWRTAFSARGREKHCCLEFVCIMGIDRLDSNTAEEDRVVLTQRRLNTNRQRPWAVMKANSIPGCTDKGTAHHGNQLLSGTR